MKALITGASSGIGAEFARELSKMGYDIIAVARRKERLEQLKNELKTEVTVMVADLSDKNECVELFKSVKDEKIDVVINNAGFGMLGDFANNSMEKELEMLDVNCRAVHILMKLFLQKFYAENKGYILNVASVGGFMPGPLLAGYYATKAYVKNLTVAVNEEIRRKGKNVYVGCLCPGPVDTEFSDVADAEFKIKGRSAKSVVHYAVRKMFRKKTVIVPGIEVKCAVFLSKILPDRLMARNVYRVQRKKQKII